MTMIRNLSFTNDDWSVLQPRARGAGGGPPGDVREENGTPPEIHEETIQQKEEEAQ